MDAPVVDPANLFRLVRFFDVLAAIVFAVSGSLVASRKGLDVMGFMWFAVITGVGGVYEARALGERSERLNERLNERRAFMTSGRTQGWRLFMPKREDWIDT